MSAGQEGFVNGFSSTVLRPEADSEPPPPYESVVMNETSYAGGVSPHFQITIADPHRVGEGMKGHISYRVLTKTTLSQYANKEPVVLRRFRDFAWLHQRLYEQNRGIIMPPLPEKNAMEKYITQSTVFVEARRKALQVYINRVAAHPHLTESKDLQSFLEATEEDWARLMAQYETSGSAKTLGNTLQLFRNVQRSAVNLVYSKSDDEEEDDEYLKVREYILQMEQHVTELHKNSVRFIKRLSDMSSSLAEFGASMENLGKFEPDSVAANFKRVAEKTERLAQQGQEHANQLVETLEAPVKEFVQLMKSAKATINDRATALSNLEAANQECEARRTKLTKLRGVPGHKDDKISEVEKEVNDATKRAEDAKAAYMDIVKSMTVELNRMQLERAADLHVVLRNFAVAQAKLHTDAARTWRELLPSKQPNGAH